MSEAYRKEAEMFLLSYRKAEWVLLSLPGPSGLHFWVTFFFPLYFHTCFIFGWRENPEVLPFFAPAFFIWLFYS